MTVSAAFPAGKASAVVPRVQGAVCEASRTSCSQRRVKEAKPYSEGPECSFIRMFRPLYPLGTFWENQRSRTIIAPKILAQL